MAEGKIEGREVTWRQLLPWTELFRGFQVALDLNKLVLAAAGILVMACGWWLLAIIFAARFNTQPPDVGERYSTMFSGDEQKACKQFRLDRDEWNLMYESAGIGEWGQKYGVLDLASSRKEYLDVKAALEANDNDIKAALAALNRDKDKKIPEQKVAVYEAKYGKPKRYAALSTMPWFENRGPNPYMLVTGQAGIPWEAGHFWDWLLRDQFLVMIE